MWFITQSLFKFKFAYMMNKFMNNKNSQYTVLYTFLIIMNLRFLLVYPFDHFPWCIWLVNLYQQAKV